jgi:hypothetical protein
MRVNVITLRPGRSLNGGKVSNLPVPGRDAVVITRGQTTSSMKIAAVRISSAGHKSPGATSSDKIRVMLSPSVTLLRRQGGAVLLVLTE